jgi:hypothetical protein
LYSRCHNAMLRRASNRLRNQLTLRNARHVDLP